mmetsp:Transcript_19119/g.53116  ORF Transcript_19119/g.53116 Transcript_19119/m.53116 type:complete len:232 (-) Transcript_19119:337-1032(-)
MTRSRNCGSSMSTASPPMLTTASTSSPERSRTGRRTVPMTHSSTGSTRQPSSAPPTEPSWPCSTTTRPRLAWRSTSATSSAARSGASSTPSWRRPPCNSVTSTAAPRTPTTSQPMRRPSRSCCTRSGSKCTSANAAAGWIPADSSTSSSAKSRTAACPGSTTGSNSTSRRRRVSWTTVDTSSHAARRRPAPTRMITSSPSNSRGTAWRSSWEPASSAFRQSSRWRFTLSAS